jgi:hypothetical protein
MKSGQELIEAILVNREEHDKLYEQLFSDVNKDILIRRIKAYCEQVVRGREKPTTCTERFSVVFGIHQSGFEKDVYPVSSVEWNVTNTGKIAVLVEAFFRGERDGSHTFIIPASDEEWASKLRDMTSDAEQREEEIRHIVAEASLCKEKMDRETYEDLKKRFEPQGGE